MVWNREEYIALMTFQGAQREMFTELFGPLAMLDDEWRAAGVSESERSLRAFGWDNVKYVDVGCNTGALTGIEPRIISDTAEEQLLIDGMGRKCRLCKRSATIPLPLEYPVSTMDDWLRIKRWYEFSEERVDRQKLAHARELQRQGWLVLASCLPIAIVALVSAIYQGRVAASAIGMVGRNAEASGKGIVMTVMVETYAVLALLASFLMVWFII